MQLNEINKKEKSFFKVQGKRETQLMTFSAEINSERLTLKKIFELL